MSVKLLTEHHLEFLSFKGGCRGSSESTLVKMSNCWKSHATAHLVLIGITMYQPSMLYFSGSLGVDSSQESQASHQMMETDSSECSEKQ